MNVLDCDGVLFIVMGEFEEDIDLDELSSDVNFVEDHNTIERGDDGSMSIHEEHIVARGDSKEEAFDNYSTLCSIIEEEYPDVDVPEGDVVNSVFRVYIESEDVDIDLVDHVWELSGVDLEGVNMTKRGEDWAEMNDVSKDLTHSLFIRGFTGEDVGGDESYEDYIADHIEDF